MTNTNVRPGRRLGAGASLLAAALLAASGSAFALPSNNSPPAGAIIDLAGGETGTAALPITSTTNTASATFTAGVANTDITLAARNDPSAVYLSNVTLLDLTTGSSVNLLTNGNFSGGTYSDPVSATDPYGNSQVPNGWNYVNIYGAYDQGFASSGCSGFGASTGCWVDPSVQAYDAIDQVVATTMGDVYQLSFQYYGYGGSSYSDLSTNGNTTGVGGNGIDILAYALNGLPVACTPGTVCTSVPEPATLSLLGLGLAGIGFMRRRKKN